MNESRSPSGTVTAISAVSAAPAGKERRPPGRPRRAVARRGGGRRDGKRGRGGGLPFIAQEIGMITSVELCYPPRLKHSK